MSMATKAQSMNRCKHSKWDVLSTQTLICMACDETLGQDADVNRNRHVSPYPTLQICKQKAFA